MRPSYLSFRSDFHTADQIWTDTRDWEPVLFLWAWVWSPVVGNFSKGQRLKGWQQEHNTHPWAADWYTGNKEMLFSLMTNKHSEDTHGASVGSLVSSMRFHFAQNSGEITGSSSRRFHIKNAFLFFHFLISLFLHFFWLENCLCKCLVCDFWAHVIGFVKKKKKTGLQWNIYCSKIRYSETLLEKMWLC